MPDLLRIKQNIGKMVDMGATEQEIDEYAQLEKVTPAMLKNIKIPSRDILDIMAGISPEELAQQGKWVGAGIQQTGKDIATIPAHFFNQLFMNYPRSITRTAGYDYPEQAQSGLAQGLANIAGIAGGFKNPLLRGSNLLQAPLRQKMLQGAAIGGLYAPSENVIGLPERAGQAVLGAALPVGIVGLQKGGQFVGGIATKTGRWVAKNIGGISDAAVSIIKRLGANRIFDPLKAQVDYIGSNIVPRVRERIVKLVTDFSPKSKFILKQVGMTPDEIEVLHTVDKSKLTQLQKVFGSDWNAIKNGLEQIKSSANLQFRTTLQKDPNVLIDPKNTFYRLQALLRKEGWIDYQGNEITGAKIANKTRTNLIKIYQDLRSGLITKGKQRVTGSLQVPQYFNKLSELEASLSGNPKFDRLVFEVENSLREDAAKVIKGLAQANKSYSDASKLLELESIFTKLSDPLNWEKQLYQLKDVTKAQLHLKYKNILGGDIYDDVLAHLANQDFELVSNLPTPGGGFYPSRAGFIRKGVTGLAKKYYQQVAPKTQQLKSGLQQALDKVISLQGTL